MKFRRRRGEREEGDQTLFDWRPDRGVWLHLFAFLAFSTILHGSGFYLFQVVYPTPQVEARKPDGITLLDRADPKVRALLQRIEDHTVFLFPPSGQEGVLTDIADYDVRFIPIYAVTEPTLKDPFENDLVWEGGSPPEPSTAFFDSASIAISLDPALKTRGIAPWSIMRDYFSLAEGIPTIRVEIEVDRDGLVTMLSIDSELDESDRSSLAEIIESTLRFRSGPEVARGWVTIESERS